LASALAATAATTTLVHHVLLSAFLSIRAVPIPIAAPGFGRPVELGAHPRVRRRLGLMFAPLRAEVHTLRTERTVAFSARIWPLPAGDRYRTAVDLDLTRVLLGGAREVFACHGLLRF